MKKHVKQLIAHPLISGSSIIFIGSFGANIFNYLFNLSMGRLLTVEEYGLLTSLSTLFVFLGILNLSLTSIFAKFSARYAVNNDTSGMRHLVTWGSKAVIFISIGLLFILFLLTQVIADFLKVENILLIFLIYLALLFSIVMSLPLGILQGTMRMKTYAVMNAMSTLLKFVTGVLLVWLGFGVLGATTSLVLSGLITAVILFIIMYRLFLKNISDQKNEKDPDFVREFRKFTYTFFLTSIGLTLLSNTDILLVRYFFNEATSGHYAALSLMGKAIFYLIMPINFVFFPLIAQKTERKERVFETVLLTVGIVVSASVALSFVYFVFPGLILKIFFPASEYQVLKSYLGLFSLYVIVFALANILNSFFLSIGKTAIYKFTLTAGILQIILISIFHESLYQVIASLFLANFLLLVSLIVYYVKHGRD